MSKDFGSPQGSPGLTGSTSSPGTRQNTLGRYRLLQRIGQGGMGEVWLAEDPRLHRQVAIKTLPVHNQGDQEFLQRFEREARAAAALNHPHILPVHDFGEQPLVGGQSITYLVMPFVQGGSLADRIRWLMNNRASMSQQEAVQFLGQAADAIDYAHAQGVIHRDIKPANMLLRVDNWLLLADFGIARILTDQSHLTQTGMGFGTPEYMAPEQAQGQASVASDNYSLVVIAYELFTGRVPFRAETPYATTIQHIMMPPPPPRQINPYITPAVEQVLLQGLEKDPARRPPSARAFVGMLQQAISSSPYEVTYFNSVQPSTSGIPFSTVPAFNSARVDSPNVVAASNTGTVPSSSIQGSGKQVGISRRKVLMGGAAALLVAAGAGTWVFASHQNQVAGSPRANRTPNPNARSSPTRSAVSNLRNPDFVLLGHNKPVCGLAWSPSQEATTTLASVGFDGQVIRWNIPALAGSMVKVQPLATQSPGALDILLTLCWSPDGSAIAVGNVLPGNGSVDFSNAYVAVYKNDLSANAFGLSAPLKVSGSNILAGMAWAGHYLVTGVNVTSSNPNSTQLTSQYELFDPATSARALGMSTLTGYINDPVLDPYVPMAASPFDSSLLAFASNGADPNNATEGVTIARVQSGSTPGLKFVVNTPALYGVSGVTWSNDGAFVAAFSDDHTLNSSSISIWNAKDNYSQVAPPQLPDNVNTNLRGLAWSPSTNHLLAAGDDQGNIYIWKFYPGSSGNAFPLATIPGTLKDVKQGKAEITALAWSNDGQWLAAGYNDLNATIYIWNSSRWLG
ncbi:MAG TPA: serine/threonine-protein kinase [Ktedonobacteraceae bacterium]|nr:serine/threonine-protein kinase [Ktedonobacteraceae bacterium]